MGWDQDSILIFFALHNKLDTIVTTAQLHKKQTTQGQSKFIAVVVDGI